MFWLLVLFTFLLPVDGVWSEWRITSPGPCSVTCGGGVMQSVMERTCIGPSAGGKDCVGDKRMTKSSRCNTQSCPGITKYESAFC